MSDGDIIQGTVASVDATPLGSELAAIANIGDTLLTLTDVTDFWDGTRLNLNGVTYAYTTVDDTAQTVLLTTPLTKAGDVADAVQVWDTASNLVAVLTEATVIAQGDSSTGDPIMAIIAPGVIPYLPIGPRDPANDGDAENVTLEEVNGVWHVTGLAGSSMTQTLTGATFETADSGLRMWFSGTPNVVDTADQVNVYYGSGLPTEVSPARVGMFWNADTAVLETSMSTAAPITSFDVGPVTVPFTIPAGSTIQVYDNFTTNTQDWVTTGDVTLSTTVNTTIPVASQTPNYAYPIGAGMAVVGAVPDDTTDQVGVGLFPPRFTDSPAYAAVRTPLFYIIQATGDDTSNRALLVSDSFVLESTSPIATPRIAADANGVRLGEQSPTGSAANIQGLVRGGNSSDMTDASGNIFIYHGMGVAPIYVDARPFMSTIGVDIQVTTKDATGFTMHFFDTSTKAALASAHVGYMWMAWG